MRRSGSRTWPLTDALCSSGWCDAACGADVGPGIGLAVPWGTETVEVGEGGADITGAWVAAGAAGAEDEAGGIVSFQPG